MAASQQNTTRYQYGEESASDSDHHTLSDEDDNEPLRPVHLSSFPTPKDRISFYPPSQAPDDRIDSNADPNNNNNGDGGRRRSSSSLSYCKSLSYSYSHPESDSAPQSHDPLGLENVESHRNSAGPSFLSRSQSDLYPAPSRSDSVASPELRDWLHRHQLDCIYHDLIENGYDCLAVFTECDEDDIEQIAVRMRNLSHPKKLKLRAAIKDLKHSKADSVHFRDEVPGFESLDHFEGDRLPHRPSNVDRSRSNGVTVRSTKKKKDRRKRSDSVFITEREKMAMMKMSRFIEELKEQSAAVSVKVEELEREKERNEQLILEEFSELFAVLKERREELMSTLHSVYHDKLDRFEQHRAELDRMAESVRSTQSDCSQLIQSQSVMEYEANLGAIDVIERRVVRKSNNSIQRIAPLNVCTKITVDIDTKEMNQILSLIGDVNEDHDVMDSNNTMINVDASSLNEINEIEDVDDWKEWRTDDVAFRKREPLRRRQSTPNLRRSRSDIARRSLHRPRHRGREYSKSSGLIEPRLPTVHCNDVHPGDEWTECGQNLEISPLERSRVSAIRRHRGSAFAAQSVDRGVHFWKIKVFCGDPMDGDDQFGFAVGFVPDRCTANQRNGSFLGILKTIGISANHGVWCDGKKVSGSKGIAMRNKDIINLCLDMDRGQVYVQRIEYRNSTKYQYTVHRVKEMAVHRKGIDFRGGYRLGCYLKRKGQSMEIMEYDTRPFDEWR